MENLEEYFQGKEIVLDVNDGSMKAPEVFGESQLGLANLASICYGFKTSEWKEITNGHFHSLKENLKFEKEFEKDISDFSKVSKFLSVKLWPAEYKESIPEGKAIIREDIEGTITILVFDLPMAVRNVAPSEITDWDKSIEELFEIGLKNVFNNYEVELEKQELDGKPCYILCGDHLFGSTYALELNKFQQCIGSRGAIVSIPHRHAVVIYPVEGLDVMNDFIKLASIASGMYGEGPGSITSNIYWYNNGKYMNLPYEFKDNNFNFYPPYEFVDFLNKVSE